MELFTLHHQWATRPPDQRFKSLADVYSATKAYADASITKTAVWDKLRVEARGEDMVLVGQQGVPARITNYAFGQLAARVGAPASYLRQLPGTIAAQNLNYGLKNKVEAVNDASLLLHTSPNSELVLRAVTTEKYSRLWNYEVVARLLGFADRNGLVPVRSTFSWDGRKLPEDREAGLYASDHDMVLGLMHPDRVISDGLSDMYRVIIVSNSEVGDKSFSVMRCLVRDICGNFILWGAEEVMELRFPHIGDIAAKFGEVQVELRRYLDASDGDEKRIIVQAQKTVLGQTRDEVLDALFGNRKIGLAKKTIAAAYDAVVPEQDGDPKTAWGFIQGLTRHAQEVTEGHADKRMELDRAGRRVLNETVSF